MGAGTTNRKASAFATRLEGAFEAVPRELFLPPGPWHIFAVLGGRYVETPSTDARYIYQDVLVAIDKDRGIHNGQPSIHAPFMSAVEPQPGERLVHIGAGTGYYTAILSMLVAPGGIVEAFEIDETLARTAQRHLAVFDNVSVTVGDGSNLPLPMADVVYVSAGVRSPLCTGWRRWRPQDGCSCHGGRHPTSASPCASRAGQMGST